jgi:hypothetical protein
VHRTFGTRTQREEEKRISVLRICIFFGAYQFIFFPLIIKVKLSFLSCLVWINAFIAMKRHIMPKQAPITKAILEKI